MLPFILLISQYFHNHQECFEFWSCPPKCLQPLPACCHPQITLVSSLLQHLSLFRSLHFVCPLSFTGDTNNHSLIGGFQYICSYFMLVLFRLCFFLALFIKLFYGIAYKILLTEICRTSYVCSDEVTYSLLCFPSPSLPKSSIS